MAYIETPRTEAGNATYMSPGNNLEGLSVENSLMSPLKRKENTDDLIAQMRRGGINLKTPRARAPLVERRNLPNAKQEFTPLLHSVTKKNFERRGKLSGAPETPAFLKRSLQHSDSPALPGDASAMYGSELGSSVVGGGLDTPVPAVTSSSSQSTPLAVLPKRDAAGVLNDQGNIMTLREQENIINKVEKENFGLKLKIHFLEESLRKSGPGFNEVAMKENTDLKVDRVTLQRELSRCKKLLSQAERDVDALRRHVEEVQEKARHKNADEKVHRELEMLKETLTTKESEVEEMRVHLNSADNKSGEIDRLKSEIEDLNMDLREKDRLIDEKDDEIDNIKAQAKKESAELDEVDAKLEEAENQIEELEDAKQSALASAKEEAKAELEAALAAKMKAEADLDDLRDEISDKSVYGKGFSQQLVEKAKKFEDDLHLLRQKHSELQENCNDKAKEVKRLQDELGESKQDADVRNQRLKDRNELLSNENESMVRKCESLTESIQRSIRDLQTKSEEKDLLHSRHDALSIESQQLQRDLSKIQSQVEELEQDLQQEKQHAQDNDHQLRSEAKDEISSLSRRIDELEHELENKTSQAAADRDVWDGQKRSLELQKEKSDERAAGLQRTISMLHETEGTLSGRETQLQHALDSEKQRHENEEAVLNRQIQMLEAEVEAKRNSLEDLRSEMSTTREDLRLSQRDQADLEEKVQALEDEIEVLQTGLDEEAEKAKEVNEASKQEAESLRNQLESLQDRLHHGDMDEAQIRHIKADLEKELQEVDRRLQHTREENQSLNDRLAANSLDLRKVQTLMVDVEAERDELRSQLKVMQGQVDNTLRFDQEKISLRSSKLKLENEASRLRREHQTLTAGKTYLENALEEEISKASAKEALLNDELTDLRHKLSNMSERRDRDLATAKQKAQLLEARINRMESRTGPGHDLDDDVNLLHKDLSSAHERETELLQREENHKGLVRELKQQINRLERQLHEAKAGRLAVDSPKSFASDSARKSEVEGLRRQLIDVQQHLKEARTKSKADLKTLQDKVIAAEGHAEALEQDRERVEAELFAAQQAQESLRTQNASSTSTVARLRTRISSLESDLRERRRGTLAEDTMVEERKDLHDLLKDAKLQAEDLQVQISARETSLTAAATREKDLRMQLKRVREERADQVQRSSALAVELDDLQSRHERAIDDLSRQQQRWDSERRAMASRVRFPNNSISELRSDEKELEKRHLGELRGLAKQIQWLRAKLSREGHFKQGLVYEKKYLLMQISMYEACNQTDLHLLDEMGVNTTTDPRLSARLRLGNSLRNNARSISDKKRPSLRSVAFAIIASARMKKMAAEWAVQRRVREALERKLEGMGKGKGKGLSHTGLS